MVESTTLAASPPQYAWIPKLSFLSASATLCLLRLLQDEVDEALQHHLETLQRLAWELGRRQPLYSLYGRNIPQTRHHTCQRSLCSSLKSRDDIERQAHRIDRRPSLTEPVTRLANFRFTLASGPSSYAACEDTSQGAADIQAICKVAGTEPDTC